MPREIGLVGATAVAVKAVVAPARAHEDVRIRSVAASSAHRAEAFRAEHGLLSAHGDYRDLLDDDEVDTVYVSLHNSAHATWATAAARAGKNVVVEKPLCLGRRELHALRHAAAESGVHVVEAVMTADHPWQDAVRDVIASGELGELTAVDSHVSFDLAAGDGYRFRPELGGGAFHDTASYWLDAVRGAVGLDGAVGTGHSDFDGPGGVDLTFTATLAWPNGLRARLRAALVGPHRADHEFVFTGGRIRLRGFLRPAAGPFPVNLAVVRDDGSREVRSFPGGAYYDRQFRRIARLLDGPPREDAAAAERVALVETIYLEAVGRHLGR
ncbi:Gfo/Idh/MocA family protein [Umezawaea endophytica]|uniref:Gfo/Idh/MocA family oxidoreductase n=1 Tax=Umezawaea endophytica TaxID=1654476 RepID=A0A9X3A5A5_9PSEU|nr:Gfo/Idh/MocA family oxidoreductase [Umezawaea endophytica]MCS7483584.1 Gfo/Idh/MocA family oxidoreductase [Umezawaea endophytica]